MPSAVLPFGPHVQSERSLSVIPVARSAESMTYGPVPNAASFSAPDSRPLGQMTYVSPPVPIFWSASPHGVPRVRVNIPAASSALTENGPGPNSPATRFDFVFGSEMPNTRSKLFATIVAVKGAPSLQV